MICQNVFKVVVGPSGEPGMTDRQLKLRRHEIYQEIHAVMPSIRLLGQDQLTDRLVNDGQFFYLNFDLRESFQMSLFEQQRLPDGKRVAAVLSTLHGILDRLREEASNSVIRVGKLAMLSAEIGSRSDTHAREELAALSAPDLDLWHLMHRRAGKSVSIDFGDGDDKPPLPTLGLHVPEHQTRRISFRVTKISKMSAILSGIKDIGGSGSPGEPGSNCPPRLRLRRPSDFSLAHPDTWFLLYLAEYRNLPVEATVRLALRRVDLSPSHLELIEISNADALQTKLPTFARSLNG